MDFFFKHLASQAVWIEFFTGYLIGSIPFGYVFGRLKGLDIRQHGSGNIGATNVFRVLGKAWGILTFVLDFLKAPTAAWISGRLVDDPFLLMAIVSAVIGHNYPIWLKFKGGKGIATSAGGLLWLMPKGFLLLVIVWIIVFGIFRYVSLASIMGAIALPIASLLFYPHQQTLFIISCLLAGMAIWRHQANIQRLLKGTEHCWGKTKKESSMEQKDSQ